MANKRLVALLKSDKPNRIAIVNRFRRIWPDAEIDFRYANLYLADLILADLTHANLTRADLTHTNLYRANLYLANLYLANLTRADLTDANLTGANLTLADLTGTCLDPANVLDADAARDALEKRGIRVNAHGTYIAYRTFQSVYIGDNVYQLGHTYKAPWFSTNGDTECHPGLYLGALDAIRTEYTGKTLVKVVANIKDTLVTLDGRGKIRVRKFRVVEVVDE